MFIKWKESVGDRGLMHWRRQIVGQATRGHKLGGWTRNLETDGCVSMLAGSAFCILRSGLRVLRPHRVRRALNIAVVSSPVCSIGACPKSGKRLNAPFARLYFSLLDVRLPVTFSESCALESMATANQVRSVVIHLFPYCSMST